jgi:hypothetical protein
LATKDKNEVGAAGEYYTAGRLSAMGYRVSLAMGNNEGFDLYVSDGEKAKMVQVKTIKGPGSKWPVQKIEEINQNIIFVFVNLKSAKDCPCPTFHIAKWQAVKKSVEDEANRYRENYKKKHGHDLIEDGNGVQHFIDKEGKYIEKWKLLGLKEPIIENEEAEDNKPSVSKKEKVKGKRMRKNKE